MRGVLLLDQEDRSPFFVRNFRRDYYHHNFRSAVAYMVSQAYVSGAHPGNNLWMARVWNNNHSDNSVHHNITISTQQDSWTEFCVLPAGFSRTRRIMQLWVRCRPCAAAG